MCKKAKNEDCNGFCDENQLIKRKVHDSAKVHVGAYASAPFVMRDPAIRDELAGENGVIAFEMEATGLWNVDKPVVPIKGVRDYADSHKNKKSKDMAAVMAACAMRRFIYIYFGKGIDP